MTKENAKDYIPLVQAWAEGKTLEIRPVGSTLWFACLSKDNIDFNLSPEHYRIKPEPKRLWAAFTIHGDLVKAYMDKRDVEAYISAIARPLKLIEFVEVPTKTTS